MGFWDTVVSGVTAPVTIAKDIFGAVSDVASGEAAPTQTASQIKGTTGITPEQLMQQKKDQQDQQRTRFLEAQNRITARPLPQVANVKDPQAASLDQVAGPKAATFDRTALPQAASLGQAGQDVRGMQLQGLEQLQQRASGAMPTIAEQQLQRGLEQTLAAQAAQANVGGSPLAQRQAQMQGAQMMQQTAGQSALAAQQERMQAEQALLAATQGVRGQDLTRAQAEAALQQQAALAGANLTSQESLAQARLQQQAGLTGYQGALQQAAQQAQLQQQVGLAGYQGQLQQAQMNAQLQAQQQAQLNNLESQFLQQGFTADQAQQQALIAMRGQDLNIGQSAAQMQAQSEAQALKAQSEFVGGILGGAGQAAGAMIAASDKNVKSNIKNSQSIEEFLTKMKAKDFDYIEGYGDKKQTGILAQDLLKSKVGKTMVANYDLDTKGIDVTKSIGPVLASLSHLNEKINKLEKAKKVA